MISVAEKSSLNKLQISLLSFLESRLKNENMDKSMSMQKTAVF
jgi:hypothetical protein